MKINIDPRSREIMDEATEVLEKFADQLEEGLLEFGTEAFREANLLALEASRRFCEEQQKFLDILKRTQL